jgi:hypothetical protein
LHCSYALRFSAHPCSISVSSSVRRCPVSSSALMSASLFRHLSFFLSSLLTPLSLRLISFAFLFSLSQCFFLCLRFSFSLCLFSYSLFLNVSFFASVSRSPFVYFFLFYYVVLAGVSVENWRPAGHMRSAANCKQGHKLFVNLLRITTTLFLFVTSKDLKNHYFYFIYCFTYIMMTSKPYRKTYVFEVKVVSDTSCFRGKFKAICNCSNLCTFK